MVNNAKPLEIELDLTVCIVAGCQAQANPALPRLLRSIYETAEPVGFEVIVVEFGESGTAFLADDFPGLLVARLEGASLLAAANHALALGRGRYIALVDADLQVQPDCLRQLVNFMDDNPDVGLASPRIIDVSGQAEPSCHDFPKLLGVFGLPLPAPGGQLLGKTAEVDWCRAGFHLLRRELFDEIGLFDANCATFAELDLYWRAKRQGWHRYYVFEAVAVHANHDLEASELIVTPDWPARLRDGLCFLKKRWFG